MLSPHRHRLSLGSGAANKLFEAARNPVYWFLLSGFSYLPAVRLCRPAAYSQNEPRSQVITLGNKRIKSAFSWMDTIPWKMF